LVTPAPLIIKPVFSASKFMADARAEGVMHAFGVGAMAAAILAQPASDTDSAPSQLRSAFWVPLSEDAQLEFERRFGVPTWTGYGQTECTPICLSGPTTPRQSMGRAVPGVEVRIVGDDDRDVEPGGVGEIVIRTQHPNTMYQGYWHNPEATLRATTNLWHHTGDFGRQDEAGNLYFFDRKQQAMRRRGENISTLELEAAISKHPAVAEAAVHAVPSELTEDDVRAVLVLVPGRSVTPAELFEFFVDTLPYFAVPRYVQIRPELPVNSLGRVMKHELKTGALSDDTWDLETMGYTISREGRRG
jgi:carnitine-CoA ligase